MKHLAKALLDKADRARKFIIVGAACAGALALGACDAASVASQIQKVRQFTLQICSFVPTASSVANLLAVYVPSGPAVVSVAEQVANSICDQASKSGFRRGAAGPQIVVQGVPITGTFVAK